MAPDFESFVRAKSGSLMRTAYLLVGDRSTAEDVLQTALLTAYRSWGPSDSGGFGPIHAHGKSLSEPPSTGVFATGGALRPATLSNRTDDGGGATNERLWVGPLLSLLPAEQRAVLVLRSYEDFTEVQTARVLRSTGRNRQRHHARPQRTIYPGEHLRSAGRTGTVRARVAPLHTRDVLVLITAARPSRMSFL